ncbi:transcription factor of the MADS box [Gryganskiella cystojenkinii]|nr:transcription factor of the MADS box [Gryganskiella cystojenkinii]
MKKAYEFTTLTGTQILLMIVSETGLVYTFATPKLQPIVSKAASKSFIRACLTVSNKEPTPDPAIEVNQVEQVYVKEKLHRDDRSLSLTRYQDMDRPVEGTGPYHKQARSRPRPRPQLCLTNCRSIILRRRHNWHLNKCTTIITPLILTMHSV